MTEANNKGRLRFLDVAKGAGMMMIVWMHIHGNNHNISTFLYGYNELNSFIVRGPEGDFYPVKEKIFRDTYDVYSNFEPQGNLITCKCCGETTFVEHPNLSYDGCLKKYFYWYLCPYCGIKINWGY